jgi:hypothetical protein
MPALRQRDGRGLTPRGRNAGAINCKSGLEKLRANLVRARHEDRDSQEMVGAKDVVVARFGPLFTAEGTKKLEAEQFGPFLLFENNHHWTSLNRQGDRLFSNMEQLRSALARLLDEQRPIAARWDVLWCAPCLVWARPR